MQDGATGHCEDDLHGDVVHGQSQAWFVVALSPDEKLGLQLLVIELVEEVPQDFSVLAGDQMDRV